MSGVVSSASPRVTRSRIARLAWARLNPHAAAICPVVFGQSSSESIAEERWMLARTNPAALRLAADSEATEDQLGAGAHKCVGGGVRGRGAAEAIVSPDGSTCGVGCSIPVAGSSPRGRFFGVDGAPVRAADGPSRGGRQQCGNLCSYADATSIFVKRWIWTRFGVVEGSTTWGMRGARPPVWGFVV